MLKKSRNCKILSKIKIWAKSLITITIKKRYYTNKWPEILKNKFKKLAAVLLSFILKITSLKTLKCFFIFGTLSSLK